MAKSFDELMARSRELVLRILEDPDISQETKEHLCKVLAIHNREEKVEYD